MKAKKRPKIKRLKRKLGVFLGKRSKERQAWKNLKEAGSFKAWQSHNLPRAAAEAFFAEKRLTPAEVAKNWLEDLKKEKHKSGLDLAKSHYLKQVLKSTESINHFERWARSQTAYKKRFAELNLWLDKSPAGRAFNRRELMELVLPRELLDFRASAKGAGLNKFKLIVERFLEELEAEGARGRLKPGEAEFDAQAAKKELLKELLGQPAEMEKLKKNFDALLLKR